MARAEGVWMHHAVDCIILHRLKILPEAQIHNLTALLYVFV